MRQVYLDYSATTPVKDEVLSEMLPYFTQQFGNPSSLYSMGLASKEAVDIGRERVARLIGADPKEIFFTGCGSEADNWAVLGTADKLREKGNHIITTEIEHHAMLHSCQYLEKHGFTVTYLKPESDGIIKPETLEKAITDKTILISVMTVNNEVGTIQPIKALAEVAAKHKILFHTDAVQAVGNMPIDVKEMGVDMLSMSAHKIYGPKGIGALYIRKGLRISNYLHGGAQEMGRRAGTENLAGIVGFGKAAQLAEENLQSHIAHCRKMRDYLIEKVTGEIPDAFVNGSMENRHPGNANITFKYIEGESILLLLDYKGISVSTGSACSSKSLEPSHVLTALGVPVEMIHGTVRFTVGDFTTVEDIDYVVENLKEIVEKLRALSPVNEQKGW